MSKVITFSRAFPATHPCKGKPTYFVEKIYNHTNVSSPHVMEDLARLNPTITGFDLLSFELSLSTDIKSAKYHTIRKGRRWKLGDKFSPRVWSGKPYQSKMIKIAEDIEVKKVWDIQIFIIDDLVRVQFIADDSGEFYLHPMASIAKNDGLSLEDFINWFKVNPKMKRQVVEAQIICWDDSIIY